MKASMQTISQPLIVALMTELLQLAQTDNVLEVGTGSGYQAAILSVLTREVCTMEIVPELGKMARANLERLGYRNVSMKIGDGYQGWSEHAPFRDTAGRAIAPAAKCKNLRRASFIKPSQKGAKAVA
jgi:protein-L-isoaspartate(D-aspartate) O-methyltransferase